jgi:hypothetical protein
MMPQVAQYALDRTSVSTVLQICDLLAARPKPLLNRQGERIGVGMLVAAAMRRVREDDIEFRSNIVDAHLVSEDLRSTSILGSRVERVTLEKADLRGASFIDCDLEKCEFVEPRIDAQTSFSGSTIRVPGTFVGLVAEDGETHYDPEEIREHLARAGWVGADVAEPKSRSDLSRQTEAVLDKFLRIASRTSFFSDSDFETHGLQKRPEWRELLKMLRKSGVVVDKRVSRSGSSGDVMVLAFSETDIRATRGGRVGDPRLQKWAWIPA